MKEENKIQCIHCGSDSATLRRVRDTRGNKVKPAMYECHPNCDAGVSPLEGAHIPTLEEVLADRRPVIDKPENLIEVPSPDPTIE